MMSSKIRFVFIGLFLFNLLVCSHLMAQEGNGASTMIGAGNATSALNDYESSGINPANLGWSRDNKAFHVGLGAMNFSIYSQPLKKSDIKRFFEQDYSYLLQDKLDIVKDFAQAEVNIDGNLMLFGASYQDPKWGGISFTVQERANWNFQLNQTASEFLFMGWNSEYFTEWVIDPETGDTTEGLRETDLKTTAELFEGSRFTSLWRRDFTFSYGVEVVRKQDVGFSVGFGVKYIKGMGFLNVRADDQIEGISSLSPFYSINYPEPSPSSRPGKDFESVGSGFGFDFGVNFRLKDKLRIGLAITDIGSINWDGNVYRANWEGKVKRIASPGINTNNVQDIIESIVVSDDVYDWEGLTEYTSDLPTRFRIGGTYAVRENLDLGLDVVAPLNSVPGNFESPLISAGFLFRPGDWVELSSGIKTGGNNAFNVPLGATFFVGNSWDIGLGFRDVLTLFRQEHPTVSFAFGFLRFKIGDYKKESVSKDEG